MRTLAQELKKVQVTHNYLLSKAEELKRERAQAPNRLQKKIIEKQIEKLYRSVQH